jgi:hypothetical protein
VPAGEREEPGVRPVTGRPSPPGGSG